MFREKGTTKQASDVTVYVYRISLNSKSNRYIVEQYKRLASDQTSLPQTVRYIHHHLLFRKDVETTNCNPDGGAEGEDTSRTTM
jgi:hypothetical protein